MKCLKQETSSLVVHKDQAVGIGLIVVSVAVIAVYGLLMFGPEIGIVPFSWSIMTLRVTAFILVAALFGLLCWVGYTLATTPPPKSIEEIEREIEQELKRIEEESRRSESKAQTRS